MVQFSFHFAILLLVCALPIRTQSWVYPRSANNSHQIDPNFEPVAAMRERLGIHYTYTPSLLHPELCRSISEEECESVDKNMQLHAESHQRRQLESLSGDNPSVGKFKVLVLLVQFTDHTTDRNLTTREVVEETWKTDIKRWFDENSQGVYEIEPVVVDWVETDNTEAYYTFDKQGVTPELQKAMYPALDKLDGTPDWDWSQFDADGDGRLDGVVMMHSGVDAVFSGCKGIYPHAYTSTAELAWASADDSIKLNAYAVASVFDVKFDQEKTECLINGPFKIGLVCHEFMHTMGLVDLYDATDTSIGEGVGIWDVMADPYGQDGVPGLLSAWSRDLVKWVNIEDITYDGIYVLQPAATSLQAYRISVNDFSPYPEYLLIENRQKIGFDETLPDKGIVIYHIDDAADGMKNRGYPGQEGWPENGNHYRVAVLPKDGAYDLEQHNNTGDAGDMWLPGDVLGPGLGSTVFPNTDSYQSGYIFETGITIKILSQAANGDMVFEVSGKGQPPEGTTTTPTPPAVDESETTTVAPTTTPLATTTEPTATEAAPDTAAPTTEQVVATGAPTASSSNPEAESETAAPSTTATISTVETAAPTTTATTSVSAPITAAPTTTATTSVSAPITASPTTTATTSASAPITGAPAATTISPETAPDTAAPITTTSTPPETIAPSTVASVQVGTAPPTNPPGTTPATTQPVSAEVSIPRPIEPEPLISAGIEFAATTVYQVDSTLRVSSAKRLALWKVSVGVAAVLAWL